MIRLSYVHRRLPSLTTEEFQNYWRDIHGPLVASYAKALGCRKYIQVHTLDDPINAALGEARGTMEAYDGATEMWWDSREDLIQAASTPEGKASMERATRMTRKTLSTFDRSSLWLAYEIPQVNATPETLEARPSSPYVRNFYCYRHLPGMSLEEAQLYWRMTHGPKVRKYAHAGAVLRYIQVHMLEDSLCR